MTTPNAHATIAAPHAAICAGDTCQYAGGCFTLGQVQEALAAKDAEIARLRDDLAKRDGLIAAQLRQLENADWREMVADAIIEDRERTLAKCRNRVSELGHMLARGGK